jgi:hypothetical protein
VAVDHHEKKLFADLLKHLELVGPWLERIDPSAPASAVGPGSALAGDDKRTDPYQTGHSAWHSVSHAVDHLHMLRSVLRDAGTIHMYAPYSVIRAALENASAAVWLLAPANRKERILRRLRLATVDIKAGEDVKDLINHPGPRSRQERIDQLHTIARREGVDNPDNVKRVGYGEIVKAAGGHTSVTEETAEVIWRLCSGFTHGDPWATLSASHRVELPGAPPGVGHLRIEADMASLLLCALTALRMTEHAWRLYDERSRSPF